MGEAGFSKELKSFSSDTMEKIENILIFLSVVGTVCLFFSFGVDVSEKTVVINAIRRVFCLNS